MVRPSIWVLGTRSRVHVNAGLPLVEGSYMLLVCGSNSQETGLEDTGGQLLDGNGDGEPGDDFVLRFEVAAQHRLFNPNFDQGTESWTTVFPDGATIEPIEDDVDGVPTSSSALLIDTRGASGDSSIRQCFAVESDQALRFGARIKLVEALPDSASASASLHYFDQETCEGEALGSSDLQFELENAASIWQSFRTFATAPQGARSAQLRVGGTGRRFRVGGGADRRRLRLWRPLHCCFRTPSTRAIRRAGRTIHPAGAPRRMG